MNTKQIAIEEFKLLLEENLRNVKMIVDVAEKLHLTNEQFYMDWEDEINRLSTLDHNKASC